jgi:hypothetical protein
MTLVHIECMHELRMRMVCLRQHLRKFPFQIEGWHTALLLLRLQKCWQVALSLVCHAWRVQYMRSFC